MTAPPPRMVAVAIADMVRDRAIEAWHYLDDWAALTRYGVPAHDLRHGLEAEQVKTEALTLVSSWARDSERGVLVIHGTYGVGKTHAAVRWAHNRHRRGLATKWWLAAEWPNDFAARDRLLRELENASALVIDDLGDGGSTSEASERMAAESRAKIAGAIGVRFARGRPTLVLSNGTREEIVAWLGGRLVDRVRVAGGVNEIRSTQSLRGRDHVKLDSEGRSPRWHAARRLVDIVGVERDGEVWRIGRVIERSNMTDEERDATMAELGLGLADVLERARELLEQDRQAIDRVADEVGEPLPVSTLSDVPWSRLGPWLCARIVKGGVVLEREQQERAASLRAHRERIAASITAREVQPPQSVDADTETAARELASLYGLRPVLADDDGFEVRHDGRVLAAGQWSRAQAWWVAAELLRPHLTPRPDLSVVAAGAS